MRLSMCGTSTVSPVFWSIIPLLIYPSWPEWKHTEVNTHDKSLSLHYFHFAAVMTRNGEVKKKTKCARPKRFKNMIIILRLSTDVVP